MCNDIEKHNHSYDGLLEHPEPIDAGCVEDFAINAVLSFRLDPFTEEELSQYYKLDTDTIRKIEVIANKYLSDIEDSLVNVIYFRDEVDKEVE